MKTDFGKDRVWLSFLKKLWPHITPRRRGQLALLFVLMVIGSVAEVLTIGAIIPFLGVLVAPERLFDSELGHPIFSALSISKPEELLLPLTVLFSSLALLSGASRLALVWMQIRLGYSMGADLSLSIYRLTLYQPYCVHLGRNSSELIATISNKADVIVNNAILPVMVLASSALMVTMIVSALVAIAPALAFFSLLGFGLIYGAVAFFTKTILHDNGDVVNRESAHVIKALQEGLGGIRDVLIDGAQEVYCAIYKAADTPLRRAKANIQVISNSPRFLIEALGMVLVAALAYGLAQRSEGLTGAIPLMGALTLGAQRLLPILQQCYQTWSSIKGSQATLMEAMDLLNQPKPVYADGFDSVALPYRNTIEMRGVYFSYEGTQRPAIRDLSLRIPKGERVGIIGTTGSGKSTLLDILMGLLSPTIGALVVDGVCVTPDNARGWQRHIAHVPQAIFLADSSIVENIAFGVIKEHIDYVRIGQVVEQAQLRETIEKLPDGLNTMVGERGVRLSGGQRQRIGIARALYKNADVIVFDEATSALDNETENAVMEAIESLSGDLTIVIIAHRLSTLRKCTQIVELSEGRIKRIGLYKDIIDA